MSQTLTKIKMTKPKLGILGGLGPLATVGFQKIFFDTYQKIYHPKKDQDFPEISVEFACHTPDRTPYILGNSSVSPLEQLIKALKNLENSGCSIIVMPCNTAHFFIDDLQKAKSPNTRIINIVEQTALACQKLYLKQPLLLATTGTFASGLYEKYFKIHNLNLTIPDDGDKKELMNIIYSSSGVKVGFASEENAIKLNAIVDKYSNQIDSVILGCTELPLISQKIIQPKLESMAITCNLLMEFYNQ